MDTRGTTRRTRILTLALAALGGAASGCGDPSEAIARIVREEAPALSRAAEEKPGSGPEGGAQPSSAVATEGAAGAEGRGEERVAERSASPTARGAARERRRRSGSAVTARAADGAGPGVQRGGAEGVAVPKLEVVRLVVSRGIAGREPVGPSSTFSSAEADRLYAFVELSNSEQAESEIHVTFTPPDGSTPLRIRLPVGAQRRFRTWASTRKARAVGGWSVAVSDAAGSELARASFTITK